MSWKRGRGLGTSITGGGVSEQKPTWSPWIFKQKEVDLLLTIRNWKNKTVFWRKSLFNFSSSKVLFSWRIIKNMSARRKEAGIAFCVQRDLRLSRLRAELCILQYLNVFSGLLALALQWLIGRRHRWKRNIIRTEGWIDISNVHCKFDWIMVSPNMKMNYRLS